MGDMMATEMEYRTQQLVKIKIARRKISVRYSVFGFLFFISPIPSRKRVARYTNIPHKGAMSTVMGEEQRLRKGCWKYWRRDSVGLSLCKVLETAVRIAGRKSMLHCEGNCCEQGQARQRSLCIGDHFYLFSNNLSSAAEIRYSARNTRLRSKNLRLACTHS